MRLFPALSTRVLALRSTLLLSLLVLFGLAAASAQAVRFPGSTAVGAHAATLPVTVVITRAGSLDSVKVRTQGNDGFDFGDAGSDSCAAGTTYAVGQQCKVNVAFTPTAPGERRGAVVLLDSGKKVLATQFLAATATGPLNTFIPGTVNSIAGVATWIYAGDGGPGKLSPIFLPFGVAVDAAGNVFISDSSNNRVRRVDAATQVISTIAGNGSLGNSGDGGPATAASIANPTSILVDPAGNVLFADNGNNVVRKISAFDGTISTIAGSIATHGYTGDNGPATSATLSAPNGLALDAAGNLYIVDTANDAVRKVNASTGIITTVVGIGTQGFTGDGGPAVSATLNAPWGITVSNSGQMYIADQSNNRIRMVDALGIISTVVGTGVQDYKGDGGLATAAIIDAPAGTALDAAGNLYVADAGNNVVRKVNAVTGIITTIAGNGSESFVGDQGPATMAGLYGPYSLAIDSQGNLLIADVFHNRIREIYSNQATLTYPAIRAGRTSPSESQTLENDGNAPLDVSTITPISSAAVDASKTTCVAGTPLLALDQCMVALEFTPTVVGNPVLGSANVVSDASNAPGVIVLSGQVLNVDPASVTLTSSTNPSITGSAVVFTVAVSSVGTTPTGNVTLLDGSTTLATGQLGPGGSVTFNVSTLTAGQHNMTASYAGDTNNAAGVSSALVQTVQDPVANTTITLSPSSNPVYAGATLTLTSQVAPAIANSGKGAVTGSVAFKYGSTQLGSATLVNGAAYLNVTSLPVGQDSLTATYSGSSTYAASTSTPLVETVQVAPTATSLTSNANPAAAGGAVTLTANVTGKGGIPGGTVSFFDGTKNLGSGTLSNQGVASLTVSGAGWTVGSHTLSASYTGDANDSPSVSPNLVQQVVLATSTIKLVSNLNPAAQGAPVTFGATLSGNGGIPSGTVQFFDGATSLGTVTLDAKGYTSINSATLTLGSHNVTAVYSGDSFDTNVTSAVLVQEIQNATINAALTSSANPSTFGSALVLTTTVSGNGSTPVGTVTFSDGATVLGTVTLTAAGSATYTTSTLTIGTHSITAAYSGDPNHAAVGSNTLTQSIVQGTSTTLSSTNLAPIAGQTVTWTAAVTGANGQPTTGPIALYDGKSLIATLTPNANGVATMTGASLAPGSHVVTAAFAGDSLNASSTSAPVSVLVTIASTAVTLSSSVNPSFSGSPVTFTSTVSGNGGIPTGNIVFMDGTTVLGKAGLSAAGGASLTLSTLAPGIHTISANYTGDTNDSPTISASLSQQVAEKTGVTLSSSANPSLLADTVTLTTIVSNGVPGSPATGQVTLSDGGNAAGTATLDANGAATFTLTSLTSGQHSFVINYAGDNQNIPATSSPLVQIVNLRPTTSTLSASATAISTGQQVVLISVVQGSGSRPPTGSVTFASGSTVLGTATIGSNGLATVTATPLQGVYNITATYSGDTLFATSASPTVTVTVGPPVEFALSMQPPSLSMASGDHGTIQINVTTASTFHDTVAFGCAGLPASATCTFSNNKMAIGGGANTSLSVIVDTGNPLGVGATSKLNQPHTLGDTHTGGLLACMLPAAALLLCFGRRGRKLLANARKPLGLLTVLLMLAGVATLSGCGNTFHTTDTPAGSYTFQIVATGQSTGATQVGTVTLTVK